jgi:hypothetical protein
MFGQKCSGKNLAKIYNSDNAMNLLLNLSIRQKQFRAFFNIQIILINICPKNSKKTGQIKGTPRQHHTYCQ